MSKAKKKKMKFPFKTTVFFVAVGISIWKLGVGKTLFFLGIALILFLAWAFLSGNKEDKAKQLRLANYDRIVCPKCGETLGSRTEMRRNMGSFNPTASVAGMTRCRYCNAEFLLHL